MARVLIFASGNLPWEEGAEGELYCQRAWQIARLAAERGHQVALVMLERPRERGWRHQLVTRTNQQGVTLYFLAEHLCHERPEVVHRIVSAETPASVIGVGAFPASVAVNFAGELPVWADLPGDPIMEAQLRHPSSADAAIADAYAHLAPVLARADRLSACSARHQMALWGQLAMAGRLSAARDAHPFVSHVPHAIDALEVEQLSSVSRVRRNPSDAMVLLWAAQSASTDVKTLETVVENVLERVPTVRFVSLGEPRAGQEFAPFEELRARLLASRFRHRCEFHRTPFMQEYPAYYANAGAALMFDGRTPESLLGSRPQLIEWLAAGIPIVCTRASELSIELGRQGLALVAEPGDAKTLTAHVAELASDPDRAWALGERGRSWVQEHHFALERFAPILDFVARPSRAPEPGRNVDLRPLTHPAEVVRQKVALLRHEAERSGTPRALLKAAEFVARQARSATGRALARRGFDLGVPIVDATRRVSGLGVGTPRRPASHWEKCFASYALMPVVRVLMLVADDSDPEMLTKSAEHLARQYYQHFSLEIVVPPSAPEAVRERARLAVAYLDGRQLEAQVCESADLADPGSEEGDDFLLVLAPGVLLRSDALAELVDVAIQKKADVVYADEVEVDASSGATRAVHRPQWSPDFLLSYSYIGQPALFRSRLVDHCDDIEVMSTLGALEYHLALQVSERTDRVEHVPQTLCWRMLPEGRTLDERVQAGQRLALLQQRCLVRSVWRRSLDAVVERGNRPGGFRVRHAIVGRPKVSIIISTRDRLDLLRPCIESVETRSSYDNREILVIDNGSTDRATLDYLRRHCKTVLRYDEPFNFAKLHNQAVWEASGDYVLLLNNDTEVITPEWIEAMLEHAQRPGVGAVGAKLIRKDGSLQHAGIVLTEKGFLYSQDFCRERQQDAYADVARNYLAVTAACMMLSRELYLGVNGMDERFAVAYNDVDLCLRLRKLGRRNVYTPHAVLYHHESASRGYGQQPAGDDRLLGARWLSTLGSDPYLGALGAVDAGL